jgi:tetratricopeptide (TPR) repeat protein
VGRQSEVDALRQASERAGAGQGQVVATVGEPGVGKSRLVYEFVHSHHTRGWLVLESASVSYGKATPYFPVIDFLKRYCHVEEHDDTRTIRAKVTGQILTLDETLQETIPALLSLLDALPEDSPFVQLDPAQRRQRTLDALKRVVLRESQVQPLAVVFEDLHWIDSETQALLDSLIESLPTACLLLLVNYRPEYHHGWGSKTYYTQLRLDPLPTASAEELLQALLGDDLSLTPLKRLLIARTEGNPFFLEESVRTLEEMRVLVGERGAYRLAQPLASLHVPATVQSVLAARIDRLPLEEKRLLQTAAVIGTEVSLPLLQAIAEVPEEALHRGLAHLQAAEFLYETRLFPERDYTFRHALTHEVAYGGLLQDRRRVLHGRIVETLEKIAGDRVVEEMERLAHHALRGEVWDKALVYCRQAGEKVMARSAYHEAVTLFEQALIAMKHLPENRAMIEQAIDLRLDLRNALTLFNEHEKIAELLRDAETLAEALRDQRRLGLVLCQQSQLSRALGDHHRAIAAGQRALAAAEVCNDVALHIGTKFHLSLAYLVLGEYPRALDLLRSTVAALQGDLMRERLGLTNVVSVQARAALTGCLAELGTFTEGLATGEEGIRIAEAVDHPSSLIIAFQWVGLLYLRKGDLDNAITVHERVLELCRVWNIPARLPLITAQLGYAYALSGRVAEGISLLEQGAFKGRLSHRSSHLAWLSEAYLMAGRMDDAIKLAEQALEVACAHQERGHRAHILRLLGDIAARRELPASAQARDYYRQALALAEELGMRPLQAHCHRGLVPDFRNNSRVCRELFSARRRCCGARKQCTMCLKSMKKFHQFLTCKLPRERTRCLV